MNPGLVSVTFRELTPSAILELCAENGLREIEWGGDVHVPHGELRLADDVAGLTRSRGLAVAAYGSYYRLGVAGEPDFSCVLATAVALGAPVIRVWAGNQGSREAGEGWRMTVIDDLRRCADLAAQKNVKLALEFHGGTLTDTTDSALDVLHAANHPFVGSLWQPPHGFSKEDCLESLRRMLPFLQHVHVFHWWPDHTCRLPLADGRDRWNAYAAELKKSKPEIPMLLEFVAEDSPAALAPDAVTLKEICG